MNDRDHDLIIGLDKTTKTLCGQIDGLEKDVKSGFERQNDLSLEIMEKLGSKATWTVMIPLILFLIGTVLTFHAADMRQIRNEINKIQTVQTYKIPETPPIDYYINLD